MLSGLAVASAARALGVEAAHLDWPNDVVARGAKLAGILVESRGLSAEDPTYVIGIGLNVRQREFSPELAGERSVTSLFLEGADCSLERASEALLDELSRRLDELREPHGDLGAEYLAATGLAGREVRVQVGAETRAGQLESLTLDGGLVLAGSDGARTRHALEHVRALEALDPS